MKTELFPVITPDEGMMLFCPRTGTYSDRVYLGRLDSADNWREVPLSQYETHLAAEAARTEANAATTPDS